MYFTTIKNLLVKYMFIIYPGNLSSHLLCNHLPFSHPPEGEGKKPSGTPPAGPCPGGPLYRALPLTFLQSQQPGQVLGLGLGAASASPIHDPLMTHQFCFPAPPAQCLSRCSRRVLMSVLAPKLGGRGRDNVGLLFPFSLPQVQLVSAV